MASKLKKFLAKPEKVEVYGEEYELSPLSVNELPLLRDYQSKDEDKRLKAAYEIGYKIVKQIDPDMTYEEYDRLEVKFLDKLMMEFLRINGVDDQEAIAKLKSRNHVR